MPPVDQDVLWKAPAIGSRGMESSLSVRKKSVGGCSVASVERDRGEGAMSEWVTQGKAILYSKVRLQLRPREDRGGIKNWAGLREGQQVAKRDGQKTSSLTCGLPNDEVLDGRTLPKGARGRCWFYVKYTSRLARGERLCSWHVEKAT